MTNNITSQVVKDQYRTSNNLEARIRLHQQFSTNPYGWYRWYLDHLKLPQNASVLELGCGAGSLWANQLDRLPSSARMILSDYSAGMAQQARQNLTCQNLSGARFTFLSTDAQTIPFENAAFDVVIANHMLYHVPNRERAIGEIRRVLKPGGTFYAGTNGLKHMVELDQLAERLVPHLSIKALLPKFSETFTLENGAAQIGKHFAQVTLECYHDGLQVTQAGPLVDYVLSLIRTKKDLAPEEIARFTQLVEEEIRAKGAINITKEAGVFIAS